MRVDNKQSLLSVLGASSGQRGPAFFGRTMLTAQDVQNYFDETFAPAFAPLEFTLDAHKGYLWLKDYQTMLFVSHSPQALYEQMRAAVTGTLLAYYRSSKYVREYVEAMGQ